MYIPGLSLSLSLSLSFSHSYSFCLPSSFCLPRIKRNQLYRQKRPVIHTKETY